MTLVQSGVKGTGITHSIAKHGRILKDKSIEYVEGFQLWVFFRISRLSAIIPLASIRGCAK